MPFPDRHTTYSMTTFSLLCWGTTRPPLALVIDLGELTKLSIWSHAELIFITVKRYKVCTNQQKKRPMEQDPEEIRCTVSSVLFQWSHARCI